MVCIWGPIGKSPPVHYRAIHAEILLLGNEETECTLLLKSETVIKSQLGTERTSGGFTFAGSSSPSNFSTMITIILAQSLHIPYYFACAHSTLDLKIVLIYPEKQYASHLAQVGSLYSSHGSKELQPGIIFILIPESILSLYMLPPKGSNLPGHANNPSPFIGLCIGNPAFIYDTWGQ